MAQTERSFGEIHFGDAKLGNRARTRRLVKAADALAQKTGCGIESMQSTCTSRLEPMIALQSIVALILLNLRDASRRTDAETTPATEVIAQEYVNVLSAWLHSDFRPDWTVHEFFLALARLGGHQNRRNDKRPGWLVLWRGWTLLQLLLTGAQIADKEAAEGSRAS